MGGGKGKKGKGGDCRLNDIDKEEAAYLMSPDRRSRREKKKKRKEGKVPLGYPHLVASRGSTTALLFFYPFAKCKEVEEEGKEEKGHRLRALLFF